MVRNCLLFMLLILVMFNMGYGDVKGGRLHSDEQWILENSPYDINSHLTIEENVSVKIDAGVTIRLGAGVNVIINGRLEVSGTSDKPVNIRPLLETERWGAVTIEGPGSGRFEHTLFRRGSDAGSNRVGMLNAYRCAGDVVIESCTFEAWPDDFNHKATHAIDSRRMDIRHCWFGEGVNEAVHGFGTPVLVEYCTFAQRRGYSDAIDVGEIQKPGPVPIIRYNVILGSDDDGIDLDRCDAYVEGNLVMNCRGGDHDPIGISGDKDARPVLVNNVIVNCENGIGFKNGADITVVNNTIVNCDRGIWLHQNPAHALVINSIIWGRDDQTSIRLEPGSTIDVSYSVVKSTEPFPGEGNLNSSPQFAVPLNHNYHLLPISPAIDAGLHHEYSLTHDFDGHARFDIEGFENKGKGELDYIDIGAFEYQPELTIIPNWYSFN